jgi:N-acetylmuramoyl-L-alanine amidase
MTSRHLPSARAALIALALASVACARVRPGVAPSGDGPVGLPPIPLVEGPLRIRVAYPSPNALVQARDSNFIFGSVGTGRATLTINGQRVPVAPNGAWLAYLPLPPRSAPTYELVAAAGTDTARSSIPIRRAAAASTTPLSEGGALTVDSSAAAPRGSLMLRGDEPVRVAIRAPSNAQVWVRWEGGLQTLANVADPTTWAADVPARVLQRGGAIVVARGRDTVQVAVPRVEIVDPAMPRWVQLGDSAALADTDRVVIGRPTPAGTYKWLLLPGTVVQQTGRSGAFVRVQLDERLEVWVDSGDVVARPRGTIAPARRPVGNVALRPAREWVDVVFPMASRAPFLLEQTPKRLALTLYGTTASPDNIFYYENDSLVRLVNWIPEATDRVRFDLELSREPYGYLVFWDPARGMVLRLRRPPVIDPRRPLAGLTLVVDPGHPPGGAIGPTGLTEPEATLAVAQRLRPILEARGARVVMTRTDMRAVDLRQRSVIARRENAHALLSIHLNAFGDGPNPFTQAGTSTLFFHPQSEPLARLVQHEMMRRFRTTRDLGIHYQNIAIGRTPWMPALITEGLFLMIPEQENAMRTAEGQAAYARAIADGTEAYFRSLREQR